MNVTPLEWSVNTTTPLVELPFVFLLLDCCFFHHVGSVRLSASLVRFLAFGSSPMCSHALLHDDGSLRWFPVLLFCCLLVAIVSCWFVQTCPLSLSPVHWVFREFGLFRRVHSLEFIAVVNKDFINPLRK